jgi:hypothetical protein
VQDSDHPDSFLLPARRGKTRTRKETGPGQRTNSLDLTNRQRADWLFPYARMVAWIGLELLPGRQLRASLLP